MQESRTGKSPRSYDAYQTGVNSRRIHKCLPASQPTRFSKQVDRCSDFGPFFRHKNPTASSSASCVSLPILCPKHTRICLVVSDALPRPYSPFPPKSSREFGAIHYGARSQQGPRNTRSEVRKWGIPTNFALSISQARSQSGVGLSRESEPQKFGARRIRPRIPRKDFLLLLPPVQKSRG